MSILDDEEQGWNEYAHRTYLGVSSLRLNIFLLLLSLLELTLERIEVALVDVLDVLGIGVVLGFLGSTVGLLLDGEEQSIKFVDVVADLLLNCLLDDWSKDLQCQRLEEAEQQLVVGLLDLDRHVLDVDVDGGDLEKVVLVALVGTVDGSVMLVNREMST